MKTFSICPGAIWSSCFVRLGRLGLRCAQAHFRLSRCSFDVQQNTIRHRLVAVQKNSTHEFVSLKMSSFKLVILWGGLKVRNLRLSLNKGVLVHLEDAFFFLFLLEALDLKLTYTLRCQESLTVVILSSPTRTCIRRETVPDDIWSKTAFLEQTLSQLFSQELHLCLLFVGVGEWLFSHLLYQQVLQKPCVSVLLLCRHVFSPA